MSYFLSISCSKIGSDSFTNKETNSTVHTCVFNEPWKLVKKLLFLKFSNVDLRHDWGGVEEIQDSLVVSFGPRKMHFLEESQRALKTTWMAKEASEVALDQRTWSCRKTKLENGEFVTLAELIRPIVCKNVCIRTMHTQWNDQITQLSIWWWWLVWALKFDTHLPIWNFTAIQIIIPRLFLRFLAEMAAAPGAESAK